MSKSHPITSCQLCNGDKLTPELFLGFVPPVNTMPEIGKPAAAEENYPLEIQRCSSCGHVQIGFEVAVEILFPYSYPYLSGTTRILRDNFADLYAEAKAALNLTADDLTIDIGSNDGTLLSSFHANRHRVLGIEPSQAGAVARKNGIDTLTAYFNADTVQSVIASHGKARLVTAANVFAHIADVHSVVDGIVSLLHDDGIFISESHYLGSLIETLQYDTIYHEHLRYYHLASLIYLLERHGLEVFRVKRIPTHGGSIRVWAGRKGQNPVDASVQAMLDDERKVGLLDGSGLENFRRRVLQSKLDLFALLSPLKRDGKRIYGIGAPSRASTLINYTGLDGDILDCVLEVSGSHKLDKYIPGTRIPVLDERKLFEDQPEYALLLSWHIADELIAILKRKGYTGKFIVPLPTPHIVE